MKVWAKKSGSFKEAAKSDMLYYRALSVMERLETVQYLRELYDKMRSRVSHAGRKRLRRVIKIIQ